MITILDGGMGGEIQKRLAGAAKGLWSATALVDSPDLVVALHQEYIEAGARMIITNTYSTVPSYLAKGNLEAEFERYTALGGELARKAVTQSGESVQVAGSLPPLSESYRPDLVPGAVIAEPIYAKLVRALEPYVDLFLCETMSSADEAYHAASQAKAEGNGKPVYIAWTLNEAPGTGLRSGETLLAAFERLADDYGKGCIGQADVRRYYDRMDFLCVGRCLLVRGIHRSIARTVIHFQLLLLGFPQVSARHD